MENNKLKKFTCCFIMLILVLNSVYTSDMV